MGRYLGIDIGGTKIGVSLGNGDGIIEKQTKFPTYSTPNENIERMVAEAKALVQDCSSCSETAKVNAVGISCGGPLDSKKGIVLSPPHLQGWHNIPITQILSEELSLPVFLQNDANACALAEWNWGNAKGMDNAIFITFGTGFGAGLILDGRLYEGTTGMAGEIGHIRISKSGPFCYGKNGSIESYCSGAGMSLLHEQLFGEKLSAKEICSLAYSNEEKAVKTIECTARKLGYALSILIDLFNPQCIVLGSIYTRDMDLFKDIALEVIKEETLPQSSSVCRILPSALGDKLGDAAALGVAKSFYEKTI